VRDARTANSETGQQILIAVISKEEGPIVEKEDNGKSEYQFSGIAQQLPLVVYKNTWSMPFSRRDDRGPFGVQWRSKRLPIIVEDFMLVSQVTSTQKQECSASLREAEAKQKSFKSMKIDYPQGSRHMIVGGHASAEKIRDFLNLGVPIKG
jgi:hypothetical protein